MKLFLSGLLLAALGLALFGCTKAEETKPDKGTSYYTGPIKKDPSAATAPGEVKKNSRMGDQ
jgi:hypothetical protein